MIETATRTFETEARELASAALALIKRAESIDRLLLDRRVAPIDGSGNAPPPMIEVVETRRALDKLEAALLGIRPHATVCDGCLTAAYDEDAAGLTGDEQRTVCVDMGADIADHLCDAREEPGTGPCACACNS